jgi:IS1 family transposase
MLKQLWHNGTVNRLNSKTRSHVVSCLIEGCSIRSTVRITGVSKKCVMRLLRETGEVCANYQDRVLRNLKCRRVQLDELWGFLYCREKNVTPKIAAKIPCAGDVWLWCALDADSKLVISWALGDRDAQTARHFVEDVAQRLSSRVQLTTDGHTVYLTAVENAFGCDVDYAMLVKLYESSQEETRYSPAESVSCESKIIMGHADPVYISTSFVERQNWAVCTAMRRYTRLSNGFSGKIENHVAVIALNYFAYNFIQINRTLRCSPAMAAGVADRLWSVDDLVSLWEAEERKSAA